MAVAPAAACKRRLKVAEALIRTWSASIPIEQVARGIRIARRASEASDGNSLKASQIGHKHVI